MFFRQLSPFLLQIVYFPTRDIKGTSPMRVRWAVIVYGGLFLVTIIWDALSEDIDLLSTREAALPSYLGIPLGLVLAISVILFYRLTIQSSTLLRSVGQDFKALLGPMNSRDILIVSACSSIGEEVFFRGAMQPSLGFWVTGLVFGFLHFGPLGRPSVWIISALMMGYALGGIYELTGDLTGPILAHFSVNYFNLQLIRKTSFGVSDPLDKLRWPRPRRWQSGRF